MTPDSVKYLESERASEPASERAQRERHCEIVRVSSLGGRVQDEPTRHVHHGELLGFQIAQYLFDDLPREHAKVSRDVRDVVVVQRMQRRRRRRRAALDRGIDGIPDGVDEPFVLDGRKLPLQRVAPRPRRVGLGRLGCSLDRGLSPRLVLRFPVLAGAPLAPGQHHDCRVGQAATAGTTRGGRKDGMFA